MKKNSSVKPVEKTVKVAKPATPKPKVVVKPEPPKPLPVKPKQKPAPKPAEAKVVWRERNGSWFPEHEEGK